ncbi:MAG: phosphoglucosamine mutase, partial [Bacteroidota bacterium]|nr:phosphoglucosamine mutase [Bacteroidota bacterium]
MSLMVSISGIRGVVGESLTPEIIVKYAAAYAEYCERGIIVVGRDGRITGKSVADIVTSTLLQAGSNVVDIGVCPTPTVQLAVEQRHAAGGISITASHNPMQWNGMKFMAPTGMFLNAGENKKFWEIADRGNFHFSSWERQGKLENDASWIDRHIQNVMRLPYIALESVRSKKFKVAVDCVNAAGCVIVPKLLRQFECSIVPLNCEMTGIFSHTPEPVPENLTQLASKVIEEKADLGIAVDPDVDR